jgi:hypothetical protein
LHPKKAVAVHSIWAMVRILSNRNQYKLVAGGLKSGILKNENNTKMLATDLVRGIFNSMTD